jgi:hypothetical protein
MTKIKYFIKADNSITYVSTLEYKDTPSIEDIKADLEEETTILEYENDVIAIENGYNIA